MKTLVLAVFGVIAALRARAYPSAVPQVREAFVHSNLQEE
jgi:hypothetical protein